MTSTLKYYPENDPYGREFFSGLVLINYVKDHKGHEFVGDLRLLVESMERQAFPASNFGVSFVSQEGTVESGVLSIVDFVLGSFSLKKSDQEASLLEWLTDIFTPTIDGGSDEATKKVLIQLETIMNNYLVKNLDSSDLAKDLLDANSVCISVIRLVLFAILARNYKPMELPPVVSRLSEAFENTPLVRQSYEQIFQKPSIPFPPSGDCDKEVMLSRCPLIYITTAINYTNGLPHVGHVYEILTSDVFARYQRTTGRAVRFVTGTDEHGLKIATTAQSMGITPKALCDMYCAEFKALNAQLQTTEDRFIRTTEAQHEKTCQWLWNRCKANGDIYLENYLGWYNVREEAFVTERVAKEANYLDEVSGKPLTKMEEPSYFFRMSKYQEQLLQHIHAHSNFIQPEARRTEILRRLEEPLEDLSISRATFEWGVPVPGDEQHVMYVWFDALTNYMSAVEFAEGTHLSKFWENANHIVGKDITWFHCVIWPSMLLSAGCKLPTSIVGHGFVSASDGRKMSKSLGNVLDPKSILKFTPTDTLRYYLCREAKYGADVKFDIQGLVDLHNSELADTFGNLVQRVISLAHKHGGVVPENKSLDLPFDLGLLRASVDSSMCQWRLQESLLAIIDACRKTNKFLTTKAPWHEKDLEIVKAVGNYNNRYIVDI
eukprot:GHVP01055880.1.p1 GENE.GHVP01055880.1~~GHVP01055880.1.p1  ORF type:complete len:661 (+),score=103.92 GHVP01055880.1:129-2111(+)